MIYKCTRAGQREDGRFHYEFEGPTYVDPPLPIPRMSLLHPVALPFAVGSLYEHAVYPVEIKAAPNAESLVSSPDGHALPLVNLAISGSVAPPPAEG